jgi:hypothetical protein
MIDYFQTLRPIARLTTLWLLLSTGAHATTRIIPLCGAALKSPCGAIPSSECVAESISVSYPDSCPGLVGFGAGIEDYWWTTLPKAADARLSFDLQAQNIDWPATVTVHYLTGNERRPRPVEWVIPIAASGPYTSPNLFTLPSPVWKLYAFEVTAMSPGGAMITVSASLTVLDTAPIREKAPVSVTWGAIKGGHLQAP